MRFEQSNLQSVSIESNNGLALSSQQTIIWINDGLVYWHIYASFCLHELTLTLYVLNFSEGI